MKYFVAWLQSFSFKIELSISRFCFTLFLTGFVANKIEQRYCFWFSFPKYALIITNEKEYPYRKEAFYWKYRHFHLCHVMGVRLKDIEK